MQKQRRGPCEDGGRDWSDAVAENDWGCQKLEETRKHSALEPPEGV